MDPTTPWHHPACLGDEDLLKCCDTQRGRSGGPGGQHRNKVETLVTLTHRPSGIQSHAGERRSQIENKKVAVRRLRLALAIGVRCGVPAGEIGSALWRSRVSGGKIVCNPEHHDYPALLAEALDVLHASGLDVKKAALRLGVSSTQLIGLIKDHPPALGWFNNQRQSRSLHPIV